VGPSGCSVRMEYLGSEQQLGATGDSHAVAGSLLPPPGGWRSYGSPAGLSAG
jgi:hypothetical protein